MSVVPISQIRKVYWLGKSNLQKGYLLKPDKADK
jgi:hypothetical protein